MLRSRFQLGAGRPERGLWLVAALMLMAVLVPTACLVYFMSEAVDKERTLASRQMNEAYTAELDVVAREVERYWEERARALDARTEGETPGIFFEHCVRDGLADSVIVLSSDGTPAYPSLPAPPAPDPTLRNPAWAEARALEDSGRLEAAAQSYNRIYLSEKDPSSTARAAQAADRCLLRAGKLQQAVKSISNYFGALDLAFATGLDGRLIRADELLLLLQLNPSDSDSGGGAAQSLSGMLQNYGAPMPSSQRVFLMDGMRATNTKPRLRTFPTYRAERMAERLLSEGRVNPGEALSPALRHSGVATVWAMVSPQRRAMGLYEDATVMRVMAEFTKGPRAYTITAPGLRVSTPKTGVSVDLGRFLPGWRIEMPDRTDPASFRLASQRRIAVYSWIAFLAVATVALLAVVGAHLLRRQMRIAHLKADLVAAVSHELKTPLSSMKLLVESLLSGETFEPARTRHYLQLVARENSRLSRLIDNFLTFSRMERNRGKFQFARTRPEAIVEAAVESIGDRFSVEVSVAAGLPLLYADEDALVTMLLNLLENAYKYTAENRRIRLNVSLVNGSVAFSVADNGIGITEREQRKIFRRFYQVDRSLARRAGGVGLGLSIVEFIVAAHNGAVTVQSRPDAGSTFTVSLPPSVSAAEVAA
ncbi:MAG TPA: HAMP domain-containing sensor histidine kinase [Bryobacteraceae bacterium]|nr:HAMP domain-containing sensor histidine kinase [Bryobacteraceae bacterium]